MTRPLQTLIALAAIAVGALALTVSPATAGKPACWKVVINDWYDGSIDGKYALHCYREALAHLGSDTKGYTSAYDDINRALQRRIAELAAAKKAKTKPKSKSKSKSVVAPPASSSGGSGPNSGTPSSQPSAPSGGSAPTGSSSKQPPSAVPRKHTTTVHHASRTPTPTSPKTTVLPKGRSPVPAKTPSSSPVQGRDPNGSGPIQKAIKKLGPNDATSVPIPLLVLAGLAGLLMLVGTVSLLAKRAQTRRLAVPPRSATQQQPR